MKKIQKLFLIMLVSISVISCKKEYDIIGLDLQDNILGTHFSDTSTLKAYSLFVDSINTTNLSNNVLGIINDPIFGQTEANIYSQFFLSGSSVDFGIGPVVDSVVMTLQCAGYFGDTLSPVNISVYELSEDLSSSTQYYNQSSSAHYHVNLTENPNYQMNLRPKSPILMDTGKVDAHVRIRLNKSLGEKFINNSNMLQNNAVFINFFKGVLIKAESAGNRTGCLLYTNLGSSLSSITIYYHNTYVQNLKYTLLCKSSTIRYNSFAHNYQKSTDDIFKRQVINGDSALGKQTLYLQPTCGVRTRISFPNISKSFKDIDNKVVINKAELVISNISSNDVTFFPPYSLALQAIKEDGSLTYLPDDEIYTSSNYFGGIYDSKTNEYRFRITNYIQQLVLNKLQNHGVYLVVKGSGVKGNRLIFGGTDASLNGTKRLRLELSYTTY